MFTPPQWPKMPQKPKDPDPQQDPFKRITRTSPDVPPVFEPKIFSVKLAIKTIALTAASPFFVLSTVRQLGLDKQLLTPQQTKRTLHTARVLFENNGWRSFWKGNFSHILYAYPYASIKMASSLLLFSQFGHLQSESNKMPGLLCNKSGPLIAASVLYPLDTAMIRLIADQGRTRYKSPLHTILRVFKEEGFFALYKGYLPFMIRMLLIGGSYDLTFWLMKLEHFFGRRPVEGNQQVKLASYSTIIMSALSFEAISYPFITIQRKMQAQPPFTLTDFPAKNKPDIMANYFTATVKDTYKLAGLSGFWRGFLAHVLGSHVIAITGVLGWHAYASFMYKKPGPPETRLSLNEK